MLHSGGFGDETYARELLESAATWPSDFVLVIHTKYRPGRRDAYLELVQKLGTTERHPLDRPVAG